MQLTRIPSRAWSTAVTALDHRGYGVLRHEEHRLDVDPHHPLPPALRLRHHRVEARDADVVVEDVDPSEPGERGLHHRRALPLVGEVRLVGSRLAALRRNHPDRALGEVERSIHNEYLGARTRQQNGRRPTVADAATRCTATRNDGDLSFQPEIRVKIRVHRALPRCPDVAV